MLGTTECGEGLALRAELLRVLISAVEGGSFGQGNVLRSSNLSQVRPEVGRGRRNFTKCSSSSVF